ncbi:MAG: PfaD family polyunsaturated fatty acid/polyketide biosynthesis protein [Pseudomonadota bacterium]
MHIGGWTAGAEAPAFEVQQILEVTPRVREPSFVVQEPGSGRIGVGFGGQVTPGSGHPSALALLAALPATYPEWLGGRVFCEAHGLRFPYVAGAMANGIASTQMVIELARAGFLGFFGAAGLDLERVEAALNELDGELGERRPWGANLIHAPYEPAVEQATVELYLRRQVRRVSAAAYMKLTPHVVRYACSGLTQSPGGQILRQHHVFAKVSRPEVARQFLQPPPAELLEALVAAGHLSAQEARLARMLPLAEDLVAEADSAGHTDNRPLTVLLPTITALRDELAHAHRYPRPIRVGAAGGLGTPSAVAAAFALGADFVLTGSVNQACVESGLHEQGRLLLAQAGLADTVMCPAADMFELGVKVQVLGRGTLFARRARRLYELYRDHASLEDLSGAARGWLEGEVLRARVPVAWEATRAYWAERDPREIARAERDAHHQMALLFRSYLGQASRWAIQGQAERAMDWQIWCGPAMGAFNAWTAGSFLAEPGNRRVVQVARNLMEGAAVVTRAHQLRSFGVPVPGAAFDFRPRPLA